MVKLAVIIPAAGSGSRMGSSKPKPFLLLGNQPILWHTITAFTQVNFVTQVIVCTSKEWLDDVDAIFNSISNEIIEFKAILGGTERQFSIQNGLNIVHDKVDLIAVHDAVRPFIGRALIKNTCQKAMQFGGAIVGVPAKDTIKKVDADLSITETPERKNLWQAQTPQIFQKKLLIEAYEAANIDKFIGTDDASLVERIGGVVKLVEGDRENLKITYPVDLKIAELILKERKRK